MFVIEVRVVLGSTVDVWVKIWESEDGADCADYLKQNVELQDDKGTREYRMRYFLPVDCVELPSSSRP